MKKWNVAIIGLGFVGKLHYDALRRLPNVHVRTIVVHKAQDIPLVKENYDADVVTDCWQEAVADPQIQVIHNCTPNALHDEINLAAIGAGKHLYAEKPMSLTTAGAEEVLAAAKAAGIAHAINYQCRMNGAVLEMRARLQRGRAGRPLYVGGQYLQESVARKTDYTPVGFRRPRPPVRCWILAFTGRIRQALSWDAPFPECTRKCTPTIPSVLTRKRGGRSWCAATTPLPSWWSLPTAPPAALCSPNVCWGTRTTCGFPSAGMKRSLRGTWSNATGSG